MLGKAGVVASPADGYDVDDFVDSNIAKLL
jgi:hypothetical protein